MIPRRIVSSRIRSGVSHLIPNFNPSNPSTVMPPARTSTVFRPTKPQQSDPRLVRYQGVDLELKNTSAKKETEKARESMESAFQRSIDPNAKYRVAKAEPVDKSEPSGPVVIALGPAPGQEVPPPPKPHVGPKIPKQKSPKTLSMQFNTTSKTKTAPDGTTTTATTTQTKPKAPPSIADLAKKYNI